MNKATKFAQRLQTRCIASRIFSNEFALWSDVGITTVLGERCFDWARAEFPSSADRPDPALQSGNTLVLVGMGGAVLSTAAYYSVGGEQLDCSLQVLDSTSPDMLATYLAAPPKLDCRYVIASKSGETLETLSIAESLLALVGRPDLFYVVTDSQSSTLGTWAEHHGIRTLFSDPFVPGRFSALGKLALIPTAMLGIDINVLEDRRNEFAQAMIGESAEAETVRRLSAQLAVAALRSIGELHIDAPQHLAPVARWLEQLIAESLGKSGLGVLPVVTYRKCDERVDEKIQVRLRAGDAEYAVGDGDLINDAAALTEYFLRWQSAVSMAGYLMEIDPYSQPEVEQAKRFDVLSAQPGDGTASLFRHVVDLGAESCSESIDGLLNALQDALAVNDYVAIFAYVNPTAENEAALVSLARLLERVFLHFQLRVVYCFGPQYLHSTGQFHKSLLKAGRLGGRRGHCLFVGADVEHNIAVAGRSFSFEWLITCQAHADAAYIASTANNRHFTPSLLNCGTDVESSLLRFQTFAASFQIRACSQGE